MMPKYFIMALIAVLFSNCQEVKQQPVVITKTVTAAKTKPVALADVAACIKQFNNFQGFVTKSDKQSLKQYFKFPVENSDLWSLIANADVESKAHDAPFSEADFDTHFEIIFNKEFTTAVAEINAAELFEKELYITEVLVDKDNGHVTDSFMQAEYDKEGSQLILALNLRHREGGEEYETAVVYFFDLDSAGHIIFEKVVLAG